VDVEYRPITLDEFDAFTRVGVIAFGQEPFAPDTPLDFARSELGRTRAAFIGDELVGSGRNYSFTLTLPGGAVVPAAGVSWISVLPSHRRRGVLRGMMAALDDDAVAHGEVVSILTASEGGIYGRFGYGAATWRAQVRVGRARAAFASAPDDDGQFRYLSRVEALEQFPPVFTRALPLRPGTVSRPHAWWAESLFSIAPPSKACFFVLHEAPDGTPDGYIIYEISGDYLGGINRDTLRVHDLVALTSETRARLWQFAFSVDLVETVESVRVATDEPLRFLLADMRQLRVDAVNDHVWVKIIDIERALEARRYTTTDSVVLEVHDGPTVTRVALDAAPDRAHCRTTKKSPDVVMGLSQLGSIYLGGVRAQQLAAAGRVDERTPGALERVDAMFASYPPPYCSTWF
jgi:predicted acetyltransferase